MIKLFSGECPVHHSELLSLEKLRATTTAPPITWGSLRTAAATYIAPEQPFCVSFMHAVKDKAKKPAGEGDAANKANKLSAAELRIQKGQKALPTKGSVPLHWTFVADLVELSLPKNISIHFPEGKEKTQHFEITICPDEGVYK
eukprot:1159664-Pelagomonas_calceolata.AAC.2